MTSVALSANNAVVMRGIVKRFPGVVANNGINLEIKAGEIHALLGENGAGKTTLMNILYGVYHPDGGEIWLRDQRINIRSPQDAIRLGIGMIHQQFRLVLTHTVVENIILGLGGDFLFPDRKARQQLDILTQKYGLRVDLDAHVWQLSAGEQQRVEILKALYRGAEILILDEPTSMLTPGETQELLNTLHKMAEEGHTIIFITHKLEEVLEVSHRVTVLRQGEVVATLDTRQTSDKELARLMVGREVLFRLEKKPVQPGEVILQVEGLSVLNDKNLPAVQEVSLGVRAGEILGIAGVAGNGQRELVESLVGLRPAIAGKVLLKENEITQTTPRDRINIGIACVPGERLTALIPSMSVAENMMLKSYRQPPISQGMFLDRKAVNNHADHLIRDYSIITPNRDTPIKLLSGGNIQRALLARELSTQPVLLIAAHPTSGLDVGATEMIWHMLLEQRQRNIGVLLISEDLEEIFNLCDRVAVIHAGKIMGIVPALHEKLDQIGLMMAGALHLMKETWYEGTSFKN